MARKPDLIAAVFTQHEDGRIEIVQELALDDLPPDVRAQLEAETKRTQPRTFRRLIGRFWRREDG